MLHIVPFKPDTTRQRTPKPQRGGTTLHKLIAQIITRQQLLVRPRLDELINARIPTRVERRGILHPSLRERRLVEPRAVRKRLTDGARLEVGRRIGEVLAARNGDEAEPVFVSRGAVGAVAREGVALAGGRFARDLGEGLVEVGVHGGGVAVIELGELAGVAEVGVAGDGVGDLVAEWEVDD